MDQKTEMNNRILTSSLNPAHWLEIVTNNCIDAKIAVSAFVSAKSSEEACQYLKRLPTCGVGSGWYVNCVDPFGREDKKAGQFKPDNPPPKTDSKGKPLTDTNGNPKVNKYLNRNDGGIPMLLAHPDPNYWSSIIDDPSIPLFLTEGAKKAAAAISAGFPCIALAGVYNWSEKETGGISSLHQYIQDFLIPGRKIYICFDADWHTNPQVRDALLRLATEIASFNKIEVYLVTLPNNLTPHAKGLDDFIKIHGIDLFHKVVSDSLSIADFKQHWYKESGGWEISLEKSLELSFEAIWQETKGSNYHYTIAGWIKKQEGGFWSFIPDANIRREIQELLSKIYWTNKNGANKNKKIFDKATSKNRESCYQWLQNSLGHELKTDYNHLCFKNGVLNLKTKELRLASVDEICLTIMNYDYNPSIKEPPPVFKKFITASYGIIQLDYIRALTSMLLDPSCEWRYFPFVTGKSRTGKSTLIDLWTKLFPSTNIRYGSDLELINTPQGRASLVGVRVYAVSDFTTFLNNPGAIYDFIENRPLSVRRLYATETRSLPLFCRLVLGGVEVAKVKGARDGWEERVRYLSTKLKIDQLPDIDLEKQLEQEIPLIASWALNMDTQHRSLLLKSGYDTEIRQEAEIENDAVKAFIDDCLTLGSEHQEIEIASTLYPMFLAWAKHTKHGMEIKEKTFVSRLKSTLPAKFKKINNTHYNASLGKSVSQKTRLKNIALVNSKIFTAEMIGKYIYDPCFAEPGGMYRLNLHSLNY